jgi:hypothetical protein
LDVVETIVITDDMLTGNVSIPYRGGNLYMSEEDQHHLVGRVVLQHKEAKQQLELHRSEARRIGETLTKLGQNLQRHPESIEFDGIQSEGFGALQALKRGELPYKAEEIDGNQIVSLVAKVREWTKKVRDLEEQKSRLGI